MHVLNGRKLSFSLFFLTDAIEFSLLSAMNCSQIYHRLYLCVEAECFLKVTEATWFFGLVFFFLSLYQAAFSYNEPYLERFQSEWSLLFTCLSGFCVKFLKSKKTFPIQ